MLVCIRNILSVTVFICIPTAETTSQIVIWLRRGTGSTAQGHEPAEAQHYWVSVEGDEDEESALDALCPAHQDKHAVSAARGEDSSEN